MSDYSKDTAVEDTRVLIYFFVRALELSASRTNELTIFFFLFSRFLST